jgi:histidinol dehydrogenase
VILAAAKIAGLAKSIKLAVPWRWRLLPMAPLAFPKVDKVVGPGSIYLTLAKKHLFGVVGIDGLYGPSEVVVLADEGASAAQVAADLIAQAEHGADSFVCLVTASAQIASDVQDEVKQQVAASPRAKSFWNRCKMRSFAS